MNKEIIWLGRELFVCHRLERISEGPGWRNRKWSSIPIKETKVVVIGSRTLANGWVDGDRQEGFFFVPKEYIKALLVVKDLYTKPFYILDKSSE